MERVKSVLIYFNYYKLWFGFELEALFTLEHPINKLWSKNVKLNLLLKPTSLNSNFALTQGYLTPAYNQVLILRGNYAYNNNVLYNFT